MRSLPTRRLCTPLVALAALLFLSESAAAGPLDPAREQTAATGVRLSKDWKRLRTGDLSVLGDASEQELRTTLKQLGDFRAGMVALFPGVKLTARVPTTMVVLKDFNAFRNFQPRDERGRRRENVAGYFTTTPEMNYMVLGVFGDREATLQVVFHEYTHFILHQNVRSLPTWVDEGVADFYSTFLSNYKNGQSLVGAAPSGRLGAIRERGVKPFELILTNEGTAKLFRDPATTFAFYAQSWAFVHYVQLGNDGKRRGQIGAYLHALDQGLPVDQAFNSAFGVSFQKMGAEVDLYVRRPTLPAFLYSPGAASADVSAVPVERLTDSEANYLQAGLLLQVGATEDAARLVANALSLEPSHTGAKIVLARLKSGRGQVDEAIAELEKITHDDPTTFTAHLYLAGILRNAQRYDDAMRAAERAVALDGESTHAWNELSLSAMASGRDKDSDDALAQIIKRDSDPAWYRNRTYDAYTLGRDEAVVRSATAYTRAAGEGNQSSPYVRYAAALASMRLGRQSDAAAMLQKVEDSVPLGSWQSFIAQFLQGHLSADKILDQAKSDGERTEAHAYIGALSAALARQEEAIVHLRWVKEHGLKNYVEYRMATADLARLEGSKGR